MADHLAVLNMPMEALKRSATVTSFDPATLLPALAVVTERLGLILALDTLLRGPDLGEIQREHEPLKIPNFCTTVDIVCHAARLTPP